MSLSAGVRSHWSALAILGITALVAARTAIASTIVLKDGRVLQGSMANLSGLAEDPRKPPPEPVARPILMVYDGFRRTFVPKSQVQNFNEVDAGQVLEKINIRQRVARGGNPVSRVGSLVHVTPVDEYGRCTITMVTDRGERDVVMGITEITPRWTKMEGLSGEPPYHPVIWDRRIATSSLPREILAAILAKQIDPKNLDHRLKLVRLFLQAERYEEARLELDGVTKDFPGQEEMKTHVSALRQLHARRIVDEIKLRGKSGQHRFAYAMLEQFPPQDVAGETLRQVREILTDYQDQLKAGQGTLENLKALIAKIDDTGTRTRCERVFQEISRDLNLNNFARLADFRRLHDDEQLTADDRVSLAIGGWLLSGDQATTNLAVSLSLYETRDLVRDYLNEPQKLKRGELLRKIQSQEGGTPQMVAALIENMTPPAGIPGEASDTPGYYRVEIGSADKEPPIVYHVQLPPEYDPYRHYPTVVTLNGSGTTPLQQLDWWAGAPAPKVGRVGQAGRHGYIVLAVEWSKSAQVEYGYTAREHEAVLGSLRDACRRFAIDTDRVYLSGHSMGGNAAWDIGLAHPDLWAGVIPIVAQADKFTTRYWENASQLPFYFVGGELDGDKTVQNADELDRYLTHRYDVTVVEYQGRGHEHFYEEIQDIFDWMGRKQRNLFRKSFETVTMRPFDNRFWWVELDGFPARSMIEPQHWPPARGTQPVRTNAKINENNIVVTSGADRITVWLSPKLIRFGTPVKLSVNRRRVTLRDDAGQPSLEVMLEDARTRADRQNLFWAKVE